MKNDTISDALINIKNHEQAAKKVCYLKPSSKLLLEVLRIMKEAGYIGNYEVVEDGKGNMIKVELLGKINQCRAIKPRYAVKKNEFEKYEKRYLPSFDVGTIIVSTPKGVVTHSQAKEKYLGGRLIAYVY
jgi:small subunit ribosomal protein S8